MEDSSWSWNWQVAMAPSQWILLKTKMVWRNITVEPLAFLTTLIMALSGIASNDLYLQKACQVSRQGTSSQYQHCYLNLGSLFVSTNSLQIVRQRACQVCFHFCQPWPTNNPLHASSLCCLDTEMIIDHRYSKWTVQWPADSALYKQPVLIDSSLHWYSLSFIEYQVNLNYSAEVCGNLTLDIHNETQVVMATATVLMLLTALYPRRRPRSMSPQFKLTTACSRICLLLYLSFLLVSSRSFTYYLLGAIEMTELPITSHCKRGERELDHCIG